LVSVTVNIWGSNAVAAWELSQNGCDLLRLQ
jgi:hypothetical protein